MLSTCFYTFLKFVCLSFVACDIKYQSINHTFYRSAWNADAVYENSVCLSVCQTCDLWQNERWLCPHSYAIWKHIQPSFLRKMVGGGDPFNRKFWVNRPPPIFSRYSLVAPQR